MITLYHHQWHSKHRSPEITIISSYKRKIIRLFCCKSSIIIMNINYSSEKRRKGNRKELVMKFIHECSNIKCDKIIEFDYLKRFKQRTGRTIKLRKSNSAHGFLITIRWYKMGGHLAHVTCYRLLCCYSNLLRQGDHCRLFN